MRRGAWGVVGWFVLSAWVTGCGEDGGQAVQAPPEMTLDVEARLVDELVVAGGSLELEVDGAQAIVPSQASILLDGALGGQPFQGTIDAQFEEADERLRVALPWTTLTSVLGVEGGQVYEGTLSVEVEDLGGGLTGVSAPQAVTLSFQDQLTPDLRPPTLFEVFPNDLVEFDAQGLLRPGEGVTELALDGTFTPDTGEPQSVRATLTATPAGSRQRASVRWPATTFGVRPGVFEGTFTPRNKHALSDTTEGPSSDVSVALLLTEIDGFDPPAACRGQITKLVGRGFIPSDPAAGQSMYFLFDGMFETRSGTVVDFSGPKALQLAPEAVLEHTEAQMVLRTQTQQAPGGGRTSLVGLTATPGSFQGTITPVLVDGVRTVQGRPYQGGFTILPTAQQVYIKFLPSFSEGLETFGLRNVEPEIRARIFEVLRRDYGDFNIEFSDQRPEDFVEYSVVEVAGPDPNGAGLFGLDNTNGKDTGNLRLNDIVGGQNAESGENGFYSFGGVFIASFTTFSPSLDASSEIASPRFDDIFSPVMPALGGTPVDASEWPSGPRKDTIQMALTVMGNLIGGTLVHEIGHSLGLAYSPQDLIDPNSMHFHNDFDEPGAIMDSGNNRPFEERAEIDGAPAPYFIPVNHRYLETTLPKE